MANKTDEHGQKGNVGGQGSTGSDKGMGRPEDFDRNRPTTDRDLDEETGKDRKPGQGINPGGSNPGGNPPTGSNR
jgi:hypothetical protein